jgi:hypothetical protein
MSFGKNYTKEKIDASGKAAVGEVVAKIRCSLDTIEVAPAGADSILLGKIPKGSTIIAKGGNVELGSGVIKLVGIESGTEYAGAIGDVVAEESDILVEDPSTDVLAGAKAFVQFLLD